MQSLEVLAAYQTIPGYFAYPTQLFVNTTAIPNQMQSSRLPLHDYDQGFSGQLSMVFVSFPRCHQSHEGKPYQQPGNIQVGSVSEVSLTLAQQLKSHANSLEHLSRPQLCPLYRH